MSEGAFSLNGTGAQSCDCQNHEWSNVSVYTGGSLILFSTAVEDERLLDLPAKQWYEAYAKTTQG